MLGWAQLLRRARAGGLGLGLFAVYATIPAHALSIELKDVASDRVERQRAAAVGSLPLPGTPDLASFEQRLATKGLKAGNPVFIRIFKAESELEVWMRSGDRFVLLDTYPICHWSGTIGPKLHEGDKQTPEGFYDVSRKQLHLIGRHPRSLNLGFPNAFDKSMQRTGSYILVHGGCSSVGCFAMTNAVVSEIYDLSERALKGGQERIHLHVFPFRMTDANLDTYKANEWHPFWLNLKEGYDAFEQTRLPPRIGICDRRYQIQAATAPEEVGDPGPFAVCGDTIAAIGEWERLSSAARQQRAVSLRPSSQSGVMATASPLAATSPRTVRASRLQQRLSSSPAPSQRLTSASTAKLLPGRFSLGAAPPVDPPCDPSLASCRKWSVLQEKMAIKAAAFGAPRSPAKSKTKTAARAR